MGKILILKGLVDMTKIMVVLMPFDVVSQVNQIVKTPKVNS
jgi:hypothetical protein